MTIIKRGVAALLSAIMLFAFSGCGNQIYANYRDLGTLQPIQTVGIDFSDGEYILTASTGEGIKDRSPVIISRPGRSILSAQDAVSHYSATESLYFDHVKYVVFSEEAAKSCIEEYFDYVARGAPIRMDASLYIVKGETAKDLIMGSAEAEVDVTENLSSIERDIRRQGTAFAFSALKIASSIAEYGSSLICAVKPPISGGEESVNTGETVVTSAGYGILRDSRLCGFFDTDLAWAANILLNQQGYAHLCLDVEDEGEVSLYSVSGGSDYTAQWGATGTLEKITVNVDVSGYLIETSKAVAGAEEDKFLAAVTAALETEMKSRCTNVLTRSQNLKADFLGIKGVLRRDNPDAVFALGEGFVAALSDTEIVVNVRGSIQRSYDIEGVPHILDGGAYR